MQHTQSQRGLSAPLSYPSAGSAEPLLVPVGQVNDDTLTFWPPKAFVPVVSAFCLDAKPARRSSRESRYMRPSSRWTVFLFIPINAATLR